MWFSIYRMNTVVDAVNVASDHSLALVIFPLFTCNAAWQTGHRHSPAFPAQRLQSDSATDIKHLDLEPRHYLRPQSIYTNQPQLRALDKVS